MNERIRELAEQAGFEPHYEPDGTFSYSQQFEKFAELLIRECADIALGIGEHGHIASQEMLEHFGVSE